MVARWRRGFTVVWVWVCGAEGWGLRGWGGAGGEWRGLSSGRGWGGGTRWFTWMGLLMSQQRGELEREGGTSSTVSKKHKSESQIQLFWKHKSRAQFSNTKSTPSGQNPPESFFYHGCRGMSATQAEVYFALQLEPQMKHILCRKSFKALPNCLHCKLNWTL